MSDEIYVAIISGVVTVLVGIITAIASYKGAIKGAQKQIEHEKASLLETKKHQEKTAKKAIEGFIMNEVKYNFNLLDKNLRSIVLEKGTNTKRYGHQLSGKFRFTEFDRFKNELINSDSRVVSDIKRYYDTFYRLNYTDFLEELKPGEITELGDILNKYEEQ